MQVKDLKFDKRNYRKHNKENLDLISKSIKEVGFGRSIVINSDNEIICGNGVTSTLQEDVKLKVVETDGTELIVVKRNDLKTGDIKQTKLGILDNSASDSSEFDLELLSEDFNASELLEMGINDLVGMDDAESEMPELASGDKAPFQQITFTLADQQAELIKQAISNIKETDKYKYVETFGNQNSNGNALFCIIESFLNGER